MASSHTSCLGLSASARFSFVLLCTCSRKYLHLAVCGRNKLPHLCALSRYRPGSAYEIGKEPWRGIHECVLSFPFPENPTTTGWASVSQWCMADCLPKASPWARGRGGAVDVLPALDTCSRDLYSGPCRLSEPVESDSLGMKQGVGEGVCVPLLPRSPLLGLLGSDSGIMLLAL